jgi:oxygen-independent coproporphyrinogen-3 oxidase
MYIHIPFCRNKCGYCGFYSKKIDDTIVDDYVMALNTEITQRIAELKEIPTIYFGGGTPSTLSIKNLVSIFDTIDKHKIKDIDSSLGDLVYPAFAEMEITFEANPEDLSTEYISDLKHYTPINRISVGIQAFDEKDLLYLSRKHNPKQSIEAIENLKKIGFDNISIDLIYGMPTLDNNCWEQSLKRAANLDVQHISAYSLTIENSSILQKQIDKKLRENISEERTREQYLIAHEILQQSGFEHYETSNFAKKNHQSKHNTNYWNRSEYLGIGTSAHSFIDEQRRWNIADINKYIDSVINGKCYWESEILNDVDKYNEYIMTAIRTNKGINKKYIKQYHASENKYFFSKIKNIPQEWIIDDKENLCATLEGSLFADRIAVMLMK